MVTNSSPVTIDAKWRFVWLAILIFDAVKLAWMWADGPAPLIFDAAEYWQLGATVAAGDIFYLTEPIAYRTPIYPWTIGITQALFGEYALAVLISVQYFLVWCTSLVIARIAWRLTRTPAAVTVALLLSAVAVSRPLFAQTVLTEALFTFVLTFHVLAVVAYVQKTTRRNAVAVGLTLALALLTRPVAMLLWVPHLALIALQYRYPTTFAGVRGLPPRQVGIHVLLAGLSVAVCIAPWLWRNHQLFDRYFLTEFTGRNIWIVTFQGGAGAGFDFPATDAARELQNLARRGDPRVNLVNTWSVSRGLVSAGMNDAEADRLMRRVALQAISEDPLHFAWQAVRRIGDYFRTPATEWPEWSGIGQPAFDQRLWHAESGRRSMYRYTAASSLRVNEIILLSVCGGLGLLCWFPETRSWALWLAALLAYFSVLTAILEIANYRYRSVVEPLMIIVVATALARLIGPLPSRGAMTAPRYRR